MSLTRGVMRWLSHEQWGYVIDGLVLLRADADQRKKVNSESTSDIRSAEIVDLLRFLGIDPCPMRSSITDQPCLLPDGHPMHSSARFHRFAPATTAPVVVR